MKNLKSRFGLFFFIVLICLRPAQGSGSPSYEAEMRWLLRDLAVKASIDGCVSDDTPNARRALMGNHRAYLLDYSELHREGTTLILERRVGSPSWCEAMSLRTYTQSIEIDADLPSCAVGTTTADRRPATGEL
jgi:hypothetical protein